MTNQILIYTGIFCLLFLLIIGYFVAAQKFKIMDVPNHRSSHQMVTIRGGGIIFLFAFLLYEICFPGNYFLFLGVVLVSVVSFIDDIKPLPTLPRFLAHITATLMVFYQLELFSQPIIYLLIAFVGMIAWINAYNFMDGINGMAVLYAIVNLVTLLWLFPEGNTYHTLLIIMLQACLVFAFFNVRKKAKIFMGDVGSIALALFFGFFMLKLIFEKQNVAYILFFAVFAIDTGITIVTRALKKENILSAHRTHLYQYLANEKGFGHLKVSFGYAILQGFINLTTLYFIQKYSINLFYTIVVFFILGMFYVLLKRTIENQQPKL